MGKDYYLILGIKRDAGEADIAKAYSLYFFIYPSDIKLWLLNGTQNSANWIPMSPITTSLKFLKPTKS